MNINVSVSVSDLVVVNLTEPVVCGDSAGVRKNKTSNRICNCRVLLNSPVVHLKILVNCLLIVKSSVTKVAELLSLTAVKNVCLCYVSISCLNKNRLNAILDILNGNNAFLYLRRIISSYL